MSVERYLDDLERALRDVGIRGALQLRIMLEAEDHVRSDPGAVDRFGSPREVAQLFADELATDRSRRAAFASFGALAAAGTFFAAGWLLAVPAGDAADIFSAEIPALGVLGALGMLLCPQISLVAGVLALLRATRRRHDRVMPAAGLGLLLTRARVALVFGVLSLASLALYAVEFRAHLAGWFTFGATVGGATLTLPLIFTAQTVRSAASVRSAAPGDAGDVFDDLPIRLPRRPWLLCLATCAVVGLLALAAGGVDEGPRNAVFEAVAVVVGFVALGRRLGLRR